MQNKQGMTKIQTEFARYTSEITKHFVLEYGKSYSDPQIIKNTWRTEGTYSQSAEKDLILWTATFIATLPSSNGLDKNPAFIANLISRMANYLSKYTMRNTKYKNRNAAEKELKKTLFASRYVQSVFAKTNLINNRFQYTK